MSVTRIKNAYSSHYLISVYSGMIVKDPDENLYSFQWSDTGAFLLTDTAGNIVDDHTKELWTLDSDGHGIFETKKRITDKEIALSDRANVTIKESFDFDVSLECSQYLGVLELRKLIEILSDVADYLSEEKIESTIANLDWSE